MDPAHMTVEELNELALQMSARSEHDLEHSSFSAEELTKLADQQRALAEIVDSPGQRRGMLANADICERVARGRATIGR